MIARLRQCLLVGLAALVLAPACLAQTSRALPQNALILSSDPAKFALAGAGRAKGEAKIIPVSGRSFTKAWRVAVREKVGGEYNPQFVAPVTTPLNVGDLILLTGYARMIDTADESGEGRLSFVLEQAKDPFGKVFAASFGVGREWTRFDVPAVIDQKFDTTGAHFTIRVGAYVQTLEIGGVEVRQFPAGTDIKTLPRSEVSYAGRNADAPWRKTAAERIEKNRKGDLTVTIVDAAGKPVANADVHVKMTKHAFVFGSCYSPPLILNKESADAEKYRKLYLELFNTGVDEFAMKWPGWVNPETRQKAIDCWQWMNDHGIAVRGHTMVWPGWKRLPPVVKETESNPEALKKLIREHILSVGKAFAGKVIDWDVVNEPFANNDLLKILGEDAMAEWFRIARQSDPTAKLYLNETSVPTASPTDERYTALYDRAKRIKELGAPIDGVGMQAHFGQNVQPPALLLGIYDRFATLGLPVRITELDIDSNDEKLQADYYRDFLTASFSHPNINGIMIWGFWEGAHWRPNAAMYRKDWSPRPIAGVWNDLIFKNWWTDERTKSDAAGVAKVRGFKGEYVVEITAGTRKASAAATLDGAGTVRIILPD
jgi:endo-1,4-beta-xylanase